MMSMSGRGVLTIAALAIVAVGCSTPDGTRAREERGQRAVQSINLQGFPPEYQKAFADGCAAAGVASAKPPVGEALVVQGWRDGQRHCSKKLGQIPEAGRDFPGAKKSATLP